LLHATADITGKLPKLDFLRAVSALIVILYHFGFVAVPGGFGVLIFFVLSGFLITHLLLRENERYQTISRKNFYLRRSPIRRISTSSSFYRPWSQDSPDGSLPSNAS
jgi:peptidoglycan/LPS O-acetylase OafA/YrhL